MPASQTERIAQLEGVIKATRELLRHDPPSKGVINYMLDGALSPVCTTCDGTKGKHIPHPDTDGCFDNIWLPCPECSEPTNEETSGSRVMTGTANRDQAANVGSPSSPGGGSEEPGIISRLDAAWSEGHRSGMLTGAENEREAIVAWLRSEARRLTAFFHRDARGILIAVAGDLKNGDWRRPVPSNTEESGR